MAWGRVSGPRRSVAAGQGSVSVARAAFYASGATATPTQAPAPDAGSPDGGAYARRYRDREHVNEVNVAVRRVSPRHGSH
jgi:hypothetical protein